MRIADDLGRLAAPLSSLSLSSPPLPMNDDEEELYLIGNKLLGLTHELLESPISPTSPTSPISPTAFANPDNMQEQQQRPSILELTPPPSPVSMAPAKEGRKPVMLPMELVCLTLDFVSPRDQKTFAAASKVCRQWYFAATSYL